MFWEAANSNSTADMLARSNKDATSGDGRSALPDDKAKAQLASLTKSSIVISNAGASLARRELSVQPEVASRQTSKKRCPSLSPAQPELG